MKITRIVYVLLIAFIAGFVISFLAGLTGSGPVDPAMVVMTTRVLSLVMGMVTGLLAWAYTAYKPDEIPFFIVLFTCMSAYAGGWVYLALLGYSNLP